MSPLSGKLTITNTILIFLIINFITIAGVMGLQNYYFRLAQDQRDYQNALIIKIDKILSSHEPEQQAIEQRQSVILLNQKAIIDNITKALNTEESFKGDIQLEQAKLDKILQNLNTNKTH